MSKYLTMLFFLILVLVGSIVNAQVFLDNFNKLDTTIWQKKDTKWGETPDQITHGGVVPDNVNTKHGNLVIQALGNYYRGSIKGHGQNTRVGGVITTVKKYASGSFELKAKLCPQPGALSAFWTFYYENDDLNHEIDFEFPGHNQAPNTPDSSDLHWGLLTNWTGVHTNQYITADTWFGNQTDGKYHLYRFDWHTGGNGQKPRVDYYYDNKLIHTSYDHVPTHAGNFNIGIWFPKWIKKAEFDTDYLYVDWVRITPFHELNDLN